MRRISVNRDVCLGTAACVSLAPHTFDVGEDMVSEVIDQDGDPLELVREAVAACPVGALSLEEQSG